MRHVSTHRFIHIAEGVRVSAILHTSLLDEEYVEADEMKGNPKRNRGERDKHIRDEHCVPIRPGGVDDLGCLFENLRIEDDWGLFSGYLPANLFLQIISTSVVLNCSGNYPTKDTLTT